MALTASPGKISQQIVDNVFKWLLCARRSLKFTELVTAVTINLSISPSELTTERVLELCRNFIVFDEGMDVFRFAHLSVQEFLERRPGFLKSSSHALAAEASLISVLAISGCDEAQQFLKQTYDGNIDRKLESPAGVVLHGFHAYASENWYSHCREAERAMAGLKSLKEILQFFLFHETALKSPLEVWLTRYFMALGTDRDDIRLVDFINRQHTLCAKSFLLACLFAFADIVKSSLEEKYLTDDVKNLGLEIAFDHSNVGKETVLRLLLTSCQHVLVPDKTVRNTIKSCARADISTGLLTFVLDLWPAHVSTEDLILEAIYHSNYGTNSISRIAAIVLDRAKDFQVTLSLLDVALRNGCCDDDVVQLLLGRLGRARVTENILIRALSSTFGQVQPVTMVRLLDLADADAITSNVLALAAKNRWGNITIVEELLSRSNKSVITRKVLHAAISSRRVDVTEFILAHGGVQHVTSQTISVATETGHPELITMLLDQAGITSITEDMLTQVRYNSDILKLFLDRGGMVTESLVREAAMNTDENGLMLLLDHCSFDTQVLLEAAAANNNAKALMRLLERGGMITEEVLNAALRNSRHGSNIIRFILDKECDLPCVKNIPQLFERVSKSRSMGGVGTRRLVERLLAQMPEQDIPTTALSSLMKNHSFYFPMEEKVNLVLDRTTRVQITDSLLVDAFERFRSYETIIRLLDCVRKTSIAAQVTEAAVKHGQYGAELLQYLLSRFSDIEITEAVFGAAAGNVRCGKEALVLLEGHLGHLINTQVVAKAALCGGSLATMRLLLLRERGWSTTEELLLWATFNPYSDEEMVKLLIEEHPSGIISESLIFEAVRNERCRVGGLKALISKAKIDVIPESRLLTILNDRVFRCQDWQAAKVVVLLQACCFVEITDSVFEAITHLQNGKDCTNKILQSALDRGKLNRVSKRMLEAAVRSRHCVALFTTLIDRGQTFQISREILGSAARSGKSSLLNFFAASGLWTQPIDEWIDVAEDMAMKITELCHAAETGDQSKIWDLCFTGVEADLPDEDGETPLNFAAKNGHEAIVSILLTLGARADAVDSHHWTPLHWAAYFGHWKVVETLLRADQVFLDSGIQGRTPLSLAKVKGQIGVIALLEDYNERHGLNQDNSKEAQ